MKKRIVILVEGDTEEEFVKSSLAPFLYDQFGISDARGIKIATSPTYRGGIGSYGKFKNDVARFLKQDKNAIVSSMLDFFRLPTSFPKYEASLKLPHHEQRVSFLEKAMSDDVADPRFLPYLQKFEFEALLFTRMNGFDYCGLGKKQKTQIQTILDQFPNPEDINDGPETAPSKRLRNIVPDYDKVLFGNLIFQENGIITALKKCPRFAAWVERLGQMAR